MNQLEKVFDFNGANVRVVEKDGQPWFVAKDVCAILEIKNSRDALGRIDDDEKGVVLTDTLGGKQGLTAVNESGLYSLIMSSRKPEAKAFRKWVTSEVLPSIRKHGGYLTPQKIEEVLLNPDTIIDLAQRLKQANEKIQADKPKVLFADSVSASKTSILIGDLAKLLKQNGYNTGQKRLFAKLREEGYLIKRKGSDYNMPTQRSMEMGLFEIKETSVTHSDGHITINKTPKVTGKGQVYFINRFIGERRLQANG